MLTVTIHGSAGILSFSNRKQNARYSYEFWLSCPNILDQDLDDFEDMVQAAESITIDEFTSVIGEDAFLWWEKSLGPYDEDFRIRDDWGVDYFESTFRGIPAVYGVWSGFEFVWLKGGYSHSALTKKKWEIVQIPGEDLEGPGIISSLAGEKIVASDHSVMQSLAWPGSDIWVGNKNFVPSEDRTTLLWFANRMFVGDEITLNIAKRRPKLERFGHRTPPVWIKLRRIQ